MSDPVTEADIRADLRRLVGRGRRAAVAARAGLAARPGPARLAPLRMAGLGAMALQLGMVAAWSVLPEPDGRVVLENIEMTAGETRFAPRPVIVRAAPPAEAGEVPGRWHRWVPIARDAAAWAAALEVAATRPSDDLRAEADRMADLLRSLRASRAPADAEVLDWAADEAALLLAALEAQRAAPPARGADLAGMLALLAVERG
ncbi:hypothetical protein JQC91_16550 [Jannaschia sp. Os4]|uniref:hypothetical protein n=1 Tax=Jannaschia sp. Os4 TaxID=2807617 RepID=UPI00193A0573|nr:hypothetical protein [Jannaschia sp. Os4]MBM2577918.1 hypothetical protein [Jannaschia sp. Os4]